MYRFCCFSLLVLCWNCKLLLHFLYGFEPIRGLIDDHPLGVMKGKKPFASKSWSVCICIVYGSFQVLIQCLDRFNIENYIFWLFFIRLVLEHICFCCTFFLDLNSLELIIMWGLWKGGTICIKIMKCLYLHSLRFVVFLGSNLGLGLNVFT